MTDVARLAQAIRVGEPWPGAPSPEVIAARLLPVVDEMCRQRAADELDATADGMSWPNSQNCGPDLRARAAALRSAS